MGAAGHVDQLDRAGLVPLMHLLGRDMIWSRVAHQYMAAFVDARQNRCLSPTRASRLTFIERPMRPLKLRLDHLQRMTDTTGLLQHALHTVPNYAEGYSTDDNARALILTVLVEGLGLDSSRVDRLATTYAAFLQHAFDAETGHFRNFLDCIKSRKPTLTPAETAHRSATPGHLGQIAMLLGRKIRFDPATEQILDDDAATRMLGKAMREPTAPPRSCTSSMLGCSETAPVRRWNRASVPMNVVIPPTGRCLVPLRGLPTMRATPIPARAGGSV